VPPGRYRVKDHESGLVSDEVELAPGGRATLRLDLSGTGVVRGRVEVPDGTPPGTVRLRTTGLLVSRHRALRVREGGTFEFRVPGDREITVRAFHPLLRSVETVRVVEPRDDVVLRLEEGPTATLRVRSEVLPHNVISSAPTVLLYRDDPGGDPAARLEAVRDGDRLTFGGYRPGTYTIWLDAGPDAPVVLREVELGPSSTDLGTVDGRRGAVIRVVIEVEDGGSPPRIALFAHALDEPRYRRGTNSSGEAVVELAGLGAGRFEISASPVGGGKGLQEVVELEAGQTLERVLDLR